MCFNALIFPPSLMSVREKIEIYFKWHPTVIVALFFIAQVRIFPSMSNSANLLKGPDQTSTLFSKLFRSISPAKTLIYLMVVL
jgi:hypothetical protein